MSTENFNKILVIGLGLIGGSFAKTCKKYNIAKEIWAFDLNPESTGLAKATNIIEESISLDGDLSSFDLIVLASPLLTYKDIIRKISGKISDQAILIDLGSVKEIEIKSKILPQNLQANFIPCHPIAGSEKTGFENSSDDLFFGKKFIICPENTNPSSLKKIEEMVKKFDGISENLEAKKHNEIYALVSHLPQFLSFLTLEISLKEVTDEFFKTAFRLDDSDPEIWGEIFKLNEKNIEKFYMEFFDNLEILEENIKQRKFSEIIENKTLVLTQKIEFDDKLIEENFAVIFFRVIFVISYLQIADLKKYQIFAGSGFRDFTSIIALLNLEKETLVLLLEKNRQKILKLFDRVFD